MVAKIPNDFFKVWTPDMAYVLGYWWADGGMLRTPQSWRVTFTSKDGEHLQRIAHTIDVGKVMPTNNACYRLTLYRKSMYDDLLELGGIPNKSLTTIWHAPPPEFLRHFVRGFMDGDGSLYWLSTTITIIPQVQAIGTEAFLGGMALAIEDETGIPAPTCRPNENIRKKPHHHKDGQTLRTSFARKTTLPIYGIVIESVNDFHYSIGTRRCLRA